jgi:DNA-binding MarR family transcriptional regulator
MTLAQLSRRLRLDKGWTSRAIDQLVADGFVEKGSNDSDRRTVALSLTGDGRAEHGRIEGLLNDQVARVIARVPAAQQNVVLTALGALHDAYGAELARTESLTDRECARAS